MINRKILNNQFKPAYAHKIIKKIIDEIKKKNLHYDAILAISRGGLIPGVVLSHRLEIKNFQIVEIKRHESNKPYTKKIKPIIRNPKYEKLRKAKRILIVDDIAGTGGTLIKLIQKLKRKNISNFDIFVVVKFNGSYSPPPSLDIKFFGKICRNWTVFPWEKQI